MNIEYRISNTENKKGAVSKGILAVISNECEKSIPQNNKYLDFSFQSK